ncbi:MAG: hypothetical protein HY318_16520 [Armatimonadetes bacterium]|nr:hypothetical protein [Armatimonadota bacterium]
MSINVKPQHIALAEKLVGKAHANGGLAPLDLERFWEDQEVACSDPWSEDCPQVPLGVLMSQECVFAELGLEEDWYRLHHDPEYCLGLVRRYNDLAEPIVGRRLVAENPLPDPTKQYPPVKGLHDLFEAENVWNVESYWLRQSAGDEEELEALLDRVEARVANVREFLLPSGWDEAKERLLPQDIEPALYRGQRGPVTFATSVYGAENLLFLLYDNPDLAARFRDLILKAMLERARVLDEEAGYTLDTAPRGFSFADDNCALLNREMYEFFGYPILKGLFDRYSPDPKDYRGQHSDSDMTHLLPVLGNLNLTWANFGPTVMVGDIREHLPNAVIHGQLAPFTFSRNEEVNIVAEFLRDYEMAREKRGLVFATAGSINNGSRITGMRLLMAAVQEYGRYDR